jgi:hypothetical protein
MGYDGRQWEGLEAAVQQGLLLADDSVFIVRAKVDPSARRLPPSHRRERGLAALAPALAVAATNPCSMNVLPCLGGTKRETQESISRCLGGRACARSQRQRETAHRRLFVEAEEKAPDGL